MQAALPQVFPTVVDMLLDAAERCPEHEAVVLGEQRLNYREYLSCISHFSQELISLGASNSRVILVMANSLDICVATFAVHMAGGQVAPLNPLYTANELLPMLEDSEAQIVIFDEAIKETVAPLAEQLKIPHQICVGVNARNLAEKYNEPAVLPDTLPTTDKLATLQFTGGTTGRAKGAELSHQALAVNISQREALLPNRKEMERILCIMPLFHCYATSMCLHSAVYARGTLVILARYHPESALQAIEEEKITVFAGSPTLFSGLMNYEGFANTDFSHLHLSSSGSAPLPQELLERWQQITGTQVLEGYGQSESGPVISFNPLEGERKLRSVGIALPQTEIEIVDLTTGEDVLATHEQGEIRIRGPQIMRGYRNNPDETAMALREGWLYTGDIGYLDDDGYLFITARKKEMLIVSGYNVFPREIEEVLYLHENIKEAAVIGKQDDYRGELPVAFVSLHHEDVIAVENLSKWCAEKLSAHKVPSEFRILPSIPKTAVGKIDKLGLKKLLNPH